LLGSGSLEQDGSLGIVAMEEEEQAGLMHDQRLGKGQCHEHKRPELIQFQDGGRGIFGIWSEQRGSQRLKLSYFFLIQLETVVREIPKVRVRPRKLLRS